LAKERYALSEIDTAVFVLKGKLARNFAFEENSRPSHEHIREEFSRGYPGAKLLSIQKASPQGNLGTVGSAVVSGAAAVTCGGITLRSNAGSFAGLILRPFFRLAYSARLSTICQYL
jgi:hypothetical protein